MRNKILLSTLSVTCLLFWNWRCGPTPTEITVENNSKLVIDSVVLYVNTYKFKFENIPSGKSLMKKVPIDSIDVRYDVALVPHIYSKDSPFNGNYYYNDLGGIFKKEKFIIDQNFSTKWVVIEH